MILVTSQYYNGRYSGKLLRTHTSRLDSLSSSVQLHVSPFLSCFSMRDLIGHQFVGIHFGILILADFIACEVCRFDYIHLIKESSSNYIFHQHMSNPLFMSFCSFVTSLLLLLNLLQLMTKLQISDYRYEGNQIPNVQ